MNAIPFESMTEPDLPVALYQLRTLDVTRIFSYFISA